jgi:hypothetical protein
MATAAQSGPTYEQRERRFFLAIAIATTLITVGGFSLNLGLGRSSFAVPLIYHVHAILFMGWTALTLLQTALAATGSIALHRRLGWLSLALVPAMVGLGIAMTVISLQRTGGPPFFDQNEFLFGNSLGIIGFGGLVLVAIGLRRHTDWHRRLMCAAMISITGPGFGRLLPMPFLIPWAWWMAAVVMPSIIFAIAMAMDRARIGRLHHAWLWGLGLLVGSQLLADALAYGTAGEAMTRSILAGTSGAARDMAAFFPGAAGQP